MKISDIVEKIIEDVSLRKTRAKLAPSAIKADKIQNAKAMKEKYTDLISKAVLSFAEKNKVTFGGGEKGSLDETYYMVPLEKIKSFFDGKN